MKRNIGLVALILLGLAIGFIIASLLGAGVSINLVITLLLVIAGIIVGFVAEWFIDESLRKNRELRQQLDEQQMTRLPDQLVEPVQQRSAEPFQNTEALAEVLRQHNEELHKLGEQLATKDTDLEGLRLKFESYQRSHPDELTQLKGVGPVFKRKLRDIGFSSFEQLAGADPDQIRRMLDIKSWQRVDIESWVQQAQDWASQQ